MLRKINFLKIQHNENFMRAFRSQNWFKNHLLNFLDVLKDYLVYIYIYKHTRVGAKVSQINLRSKRMWRSRAAFIRIFFENFASIHISIILTCVIFRTPFGLFPPVNKNGWKRIFRLVHSRASLNRAEHFFSRFTDGGIRIGGSRRKSSRRRSRRVIVIPSRNLYI